MLKVLLVEDFPLAIKVAQYILTSLDCDVDVASTGEQAVDKALHNEYTMILMDIGLPDCTGFDATHRIRDAGVETPIYALTAHTDQDYKNQARESGMNGFLIKPIEEGEIQELIARNANLRYDEQSKGK